jgi:hypothetical protein
MADLRLNTTAPGHMSGLSQLPVEPIPQPTQDELSFCKQFVDDYNKLPDEVKATEANRRIYAKCREMLLNQRAPGGLIQAFEKGGAVLSKEDSVLEKLKELLRPKPIVAPGTETSTIGTRG